MKILHRYILTQLLKNLLTCLSVLIFLFLVFDFFDRIDDLMEEHASIGTIFKYFLYKIPLTVSLMLPLAMLLATLLTISLLSRNSEFTAMRAAGLRIWWLVQPVVIAGVVLSVFALIFQETVVPYTARRVREIYNIDVREKDKTGNYSQSNFWWRSGNTFYSVNTFDSRTNTLLNFSRFDIGDAFRVAHRTIAEKVIFLKPGLGWQMQRGQELTFHPKIAPEVKNFNELPLPIQERPKDFYDAETDPHTMSYSQLQAFIGKQLANGLPIADYLADLYAKISFPFVTLIISLAVLPFALVPARTGSLAFSLMAGVTVGFVYHVIHSFSIALGRAEIWHPMVAAWMANILLTVVGLILHLGAESPA